MQAQENGYITVVGAVNIDIGGTSLEPLVMGDSNPGRVKVSMGGVGRNIAENISRLGMPVRFITVMGDDAYSHQIAKSCRELGIDLSMSRVVPGENTSTYLCIHDADGVMRLAVSDMEICRHLTPAFLAGHMAAINASRLVVADANLPEEAIAFLAENCTAPLFFDPVSVKKSLRMKAHLARVFCIKPNRPEAEALSGISIRGTGDLPKAAAALQAKGVRVVFISLGEEGVYFDDGAQRGILPCFPGKVVNTTGCGDAFMAAAAVACCAGAGAAGMARMGLAGAALCATAQEAVAKDLSLELLQNKLLEAGGESK